MLLSRYQIFLTQPNDSIPSKFHKLFYVYQQTNSKVYMEREKPRIPNTIWKKNNVGGLILFDFENYYKATIIRIWWHWQKKQQTDQCNRK